MYAIKCINIIKCFEVYVLSMLLIYLWVLNIWIHTIINDINPNIFFTI